MIYLPNIPEKGLMPGMARILSIKLSILIIGILVTLSAQAQHSEEDAIKKLIRSGTLAYFGKNTDDWQNSWLQDPEISRSVISIYGFTNTRGWENLWPMMEPHFKGGQEAIPVELSTDNTIIHTSDNMAWVEYDQIIKVPSMDPSFKQVSREHRVLVKKDGHWKIVSQITISPESFSDSPEAIEGSLNSTGYKLLGVNNSKYAIEVFSVATQMNPQSSYAFQGLAEAYAQDGSTELAIKHYEKAIELDPENQNARDALDKLKQ